MTSGCTNVCLASNGNCANSCVKIHSETSLQAHLLSDCPYASLKCKLCQYCFIKSAGHSCNIKDVAMHSLAQAKQIKEQAIEIKEI